MVILLRLTSVRSRLVWTLGLSQEGMNPEPKTLDHVFIPFHFNAFQFSRLCIVFIWIYRLNFLARNLAVDCVRGGIRILLMCLILILPLLPAFVQESGAMLTPNINLC